MDILATELKTRVDGELRTLVGSDFENLVNSSMELPSTQELKDYLASEITTIGIVSKAKDNLQ